MAEENLTATQKAWKEAVRLGLIHAREYGVEDAGFRKIWQEMIFHMLILEGHDPESVGQWKVENKKNMHHTVQGVLAYETFKLDVLVLLNKARKAQW